MRTVSNPTGFRVMYIHIFQEQDIIIIINEYDLNIVNFTDKCTGKWTHVVRTTGETSLLDYIIVPKTVMGSIKEMIIDEDCMICPFTSKKNGEVIKYSDHNACLTTAEIDVPLKVKKTPEYKWKFDEDSLEQIKQMTSTENFDYGPLSGNVQCDYDTLEKEMNRLMSLTCRKQKRKTTFHNQVKGRFIHYFSVLSKYGAKGKVQRMVTKQYKEVVLELSRNEESKVRAKCLSRTIKSLTVNGDFSPSEFWKVKKSVIKKTEEISSIIDPAVETELFGEDPVRNIAISPLSRIDLYLTSY